MSDQQTLQPLIALGTIVVGPNSQGDLAVDIRLKLGVSSELKEMFDRAAASFLTEFAKGLTPEEQTTTGELSPELEKVRQSLANNVS